MKLIFAISIVALSFFGTACRRSVGEMILVPMPQEATFTGGYFETDSARFVERAGDGYVACRIDPSAPEIRPEGYRLKVTRRGIDLTALDSAGLFYGRQTLCLLATAQGIPCVEIIDNPCFGYRGIHLDVSRHFFPVETIFRLLDEMARYKLNKFHFHLADNGGWRIRIDAYPLLTRLGAFRTESDWLEWWSYGDRHYVPEDTPGAYGGYYTKEEIRRIVAYAAERFIEVIPEIEFPGHSDEVFAAYPELCCSGRAYTSGEFCVGNPLSLKFMDEVLTEVLELFPSKYIHIGGDEANYSRWDNNAKIKAFMKEHGLHTYPDMQLYAINEISKYLDKKGVKMIGWNEITGDNIRNEAGRGENSAIQLKPGTLVQFWDGSTEFAKKAIAKGYEVVNSNRLFTYIDYSYESIPLTRAYSFNPYFDGLTDEQKTKVLGCGCQMWGEAPTDKRIYFQTFPRLAAYAEAGWTPNDLKNYADFVRRITPIEQTWKQKGYFVGQPSFTMGKTEEPK